MIHYIKQGQAQYKANLHCHSVISDGKLTPEELKDAYRRHGYSILAITDHEVPYDHSAMTDKDFLMLTGYEAYIRLSPTGKASAYEPELHCNLIAKDPHNVKYVCFNENYCKYVKDPAVREKFEKVGSQRTREYSVAYINEFVQTAIDNGYLCTYKHPTWSLELHEQIEQYRGFFSMEMSNYSSFVINRMEYNGALYDRLLRAGHRLFCHSADDNHNKGGVDTKDSDSFGGFAYILAPELTYESVIQALEKGDFYSSMGPQILSLSFDGNKVHIETSDALQITMFCGGKSTKVVRGDFENPVHEADFEIPAEAPYVRLNVCDAHGRYADTRGFFRDELGI